MVEDGHLSNSFQYGSKPYYLDDINRKNTNDCRNNNDSCVVVIENDGRRDESTDDEMCERNALKIKTPTVATTTASATTINAKPACVTANAAVALPAPTLSSVLSESVSNSKSTAQLPLRFEEIGYSPELNSSSHVDGVPSQNYYVTKDTGNGRGADGGVEDEQRFSERTSPQEIHKTLIAFGLLIFNFFLTTTSLAIIHDRVPKEGPLPDLVLGLVTPREWALPVSEVLIVVTTSIMLIIIFAHKYRFIILRRLFLMLSLLYFMRSITMFVTVLPVSSLTYVCSEQKSFTDPAEVMRRSLSLFFGMGLTINGRHVYCGDYIYSGHTTILVMSYLMISEYSSKRIFWLHWATWFMSLTGVLMVLLSHSHYTVDVIIGYFVTTRLFWMYHTCANNQLLKKRSMYNYLAREWWFSLFQYFECNVRGSLVPLEYR